MSAGLNVMAWREVLERIFAGFVRQCDVSPDWLINPSTRRRLKLDILYPEIGIAIRFVGLQGNRRGAISDWEVAEQEQREDVREELCRQQGIVLVAIPVISDRPGDVLRTLSDAIGRATRAMAKGSTRLSEKRRLMPLLAEARTRCEQMIPRIRRPDDLALFAELGRDREAALVSSLEPTSPPRPRSSPPAYRLGMQVTHPVFGEGTIRALTPDGDDLRVTVDFVRAGERTLLASLVADKLKPA